MKIKSLLILILSGLLNSCKSPGPEVSASIENKVENLLARMTLEEKIGQLVQKNAKTFSDHLVKSGGIGSVLNEVDVEEINRIQQIAVEGSRLGIPVIFARDVIHGFKTIMPIPLGQAASWNPMLVEKAANISAIEARSSGIRWNFAPMIDVTRDPRWGRIAEGFGEDPYLVSELARASVKGYQGSDLSNKNSLAACAKHFAAYGAVEGGRDYHTVNLPENELREVYLPPFKAAVETGVATIMTSFNELNGIPVTANEFLLKQILRKEWKYSGMVVSDWFSIQQLVVHGYAVDEKEAADKSIRAGVDMEMSSACYGDHLASLVNEKKMPIGFIDEAVRNILRLKYKMGLFENPYTNPEDYPSVLNDENKTVSKELAKESLVLLKNNNSTLPLSMAKGNYAIIGPLADQPYEQLGTWVFDGDKSHSITPLTAIRGLIGNKRVNFSPGMAISRSMDKRGFKDAVTAAQKSDIVLLFLGEESILSGESHCRADISLPGLQSELVEAIAATGKPIVAVVMAGRPLTFEDEAKHLDAILYAWHPGTMAGPAIADILFGLEAPSGKLPVTFPRTVGQVPVYYAQKNSGKPASDETWQRMYEIPVEAPQLSIGNTNHYIDYGFEPWFPFGYGLSYTSFDYAGLSISPNKVKPGDYIHVTATVTNTGTFEGKEVAQLYIRDLVGSTTRPVKQLKAFVKVNLKPGESKQIEFRIHASQLGFYNQEMKFVAEPGEFMAGIGGDSGVEPNLKFEIVE